MRGADVLDVVVVEIHRHAASPQRLMILRAGQRRQAEKLHDVDRQFALDDVDVVADRFRRVGGKPQDIAAVAFLKRLSPLCR
jgi:hypothetical protein